MTTFVRDPRASRTVIANRWRDAYEPLHFLPDVPLHPTQVRGDAIDALGIAGDET